MWCKLTSRVAHEHVDALLARADAIVSSSDHKETVNWDGKDFFVGEYAEDDNFGLLRLFHLQIWPEISNVTAFDVPVIDHASLLIKGAGAAGTAIHQDRPYWVRKEASPTIFSVWIALEDMSKERGGLMLSRENQIGVSEMTSFNTGSVLEHEQGAPAGGFPISIPDQIADRMAESMRFVDMVKGEAVAFDSFEPHMSGPNITASPRLAMKIAYAEGTGKTLYLARTDALEGRGSCEGLGQLNQ
ncbi:MAG: phytanoyl-CoA dioxygenase family protein [Gammaproteobacteria bacterium]|nr:phytanoyl-CoA dioxygenase family protein [Gammaproteobacteria bacterium]